MRVILSGGGTAGHINPALALADYFKLKDNNTEILFIGTERGLESKLIPQKGYNIKFVKVEGLSKKLTVSNVRSFIHLLTSKGKCKKIIKDFKPDIVIGTGGYVCAPVIMAANSMGIPTLLHESNVFPGKAIRLLSKKSSLTAISFEDSKKYLPDAKKIVVTGNPIRPDILSTKREEARKSLGVGDEFFVLIFGGSLGANKINEVSLDYIKNINENDNIKILFGTGERNYAEIKEKAKNMGINKSHINIVPYIDNMNEAMNAADLVICRSGAITVSEICALSKPAIFIPSPNVTHNHQEYNARALSDKGGAITILERDFSLSSLTESINAIICDEKKTENMKKILLALAKLDALDIIYNEIKALI